MALKDWKKQKIYSHPNIFLYEWKKRNQDMIEIMHIADGIHVRILDYYPGTQNYLASAKIDKIFKTKQQALKFAKSYMRKH